MIKNYLTTSFRNLLRHKTYTFINVIGLTAGLATSILILLWIVDEVSFDRDPHGGRVYHVFVNNAYPDGKIETYPATPAKLKDLLVREIPDVESAVQYSFEEELRVRVDGESYNEVGIYADPALFDIFGFRITKGNDAMPLTDIKSIAISQTLANKLFKQENPIGKVVTIGASHDLVVTSIFADIPQHSSLRFDFVASFELYVRENPWTQHWQSGGTRTTVLLRATAIPEETNAKLTDLIHNNCHECTTTPFLFPYAKARLYNEFRNGKNAGGRIQQVYLFGAIALLILVMACINFTNLSTARATVRSREVGIRKSIGAQKGSLVAQFIGESLVLSFVALLLAVVVVQLLLPLFNEATSKAIRPDLDNPWLIAGMLGITLMSGFLAGTYPAFVLSRFNPVSVLKGETKSALTGNGLRKLLVVVQFTTSAILVVGSLALYKQIAFISEKNLGFSKDNVIVVNQNEGFARSYQSIKRDLSQSSHVTGVAFGGSNIFTIPITTTDPVWKGKPDNSSLLFKIYRCDADLIPTLNIKMAQGRNFTDGRQDASNYIINRKAAEVMGLSSESAVGSELEMWNGKGRIIGVTEDFHNGNLKFGIEPMIFMYSENVGAHYFIRTNANSSVAEAVQHIEKIFKKQEPDYPFEFTFLDEVFSKEYQTEAVMGKLALGFTVIAVLMSCLGLVGLASFSAERRTKELGIRKVMGASVGDLLMMLCRDFAGLVLVSLLIGFPVSWYVTGRYFAGHAFHASIGWDIYLITAVVMIALVVLSVGLQSTRASMVNPVKSLRNE